MAKRKVSPGHWNLMKNKFIPTLTAEEREKLLHRHMEEMSKEELEEMKVKLSVAVQQYRRDRVGGVSQKVLNGEM